MQFGNPLETLATPTVDAVLTCLFQVKLALLTTILLLSAEWLPAGWKRRRVIAVCVVAMSVDLLGTAAVQVLADVAAEPAGKAAADPISTPSSARPFAPGTSFGRAKQFHGDPVAAPALVETT